MSLTNHILQDRGPLRQSAISKSTALLLLIFCLATYHDTATITDIICAGMGSASELSGQLKLPAMFSSLSKIYVILDLLGFTMKSA